jgi:hypothetical protein
MRHKFLIVIAVAVAGSMAGAQSFTRQPYTTFIPGTLAQDLVVSPKGGWVFIVGTTTIPEYPVTANAFDRTCGTDGACNPFQGRFGIERQADIVITAIDAAGQIGYSTFLGGAFRDDNPRVAISPDGILWIAGHTTSPAFEGQPAGCTGLFVARFAFTMDRIEQLHCLGGPSLIDIALDAEGHLWVLANATQPAPTRNALQPNHGGLNDMFLAEIVAGETAPRMATHIGGRSLDIPHALAVTPNGHIAVAGSTTSVDFPVVRPLHPSRSTSIVNGDAVVLVMDRSGTFLQFSTFLGGSSHDEAHGVAVDAGGNVYVTGHSRSTDMIVTEGAAAPRCGSTIGCFDAFVTKLDATGALLASSFYGGSALDTGRSIAIGPHGAAMMLGTTQSPDFPLVNARPFTRWTPAVNFEHTCLTVFNSRLEQVTNARFVGDERALPNVARFTIRDGFAYVAGQVTPSTGASAYGTYLTAFRLP